MNKDIRYGYLHLTQDKEFAQRLMEKLQAQGQQAHDQQQRQQRAQEIVNELKRKYSNK